MKVNFKSTKYWRMKLKQITKKGHKKTKLTLQIQNPIHETKIRKLNIEWWNWKKKDKF